MHSSTSRTAFSRPLLAMLTSKHTLMATLLFVALAWIGNAQAATLVVDYNLGHDGNGVVKVDSADSDCSLIEAIENANADAQTHTDCDAGSGADTIVLPFRVTFPLDNNSVPTPFHSATYGDSGLPLITSDITIEGHGSEIVRVEQTGSTPTAKFRILTVLNTGTLTLEELALRGGNASGGGSRYENSGGGLFNDGTTTLDHVIVAGNYAEHGGGGLHNHYKNGTLNVFNSSVSHNRSASYAGGINVSGTVNITRSTIADNSAVLGGGISTGGGSTLTIRHSSITGNSASQDNGGMNNFNSQVVLNHVSIVNNTAPRGAGLGIIFSGASGGTMPVTTLRNTLIAANTDNAGGPNNCGIRAGAPPPTLEGGNLTNDDNGGCGLTVKADLVLVSDGGSIGLLADNGGPTQTHALLPGSSAIDAATDVAGQDACGNGGNAIDQRGVTRPQDGDASGSAECDVGAFEFDTPITVDLKAGSASEGEVAVAANGLCSLNEAIENANDTTSGQVSVDCEAGNPGGMDRIILPTNARFTLDNDSVPMPYDTRLNGSSGVSVGFSGMPGITSEITIEGNGSEVVRPDQTGSTATAGFRILSIISSGTITLRNLTLKGGVANGSTLRGGRGGGIFNAGKVMLDHVAVVSNFAKDAAGGIYNAGLMQLRHSTVSDNKANDSVGGGIWQSGRDKMIIRNSSITANTSSKGGGGIYATEDLMIVNSTISGNHGGYGGGIHASGIALTLNHVSIINNSGTGQGGGMSLRGYNTLATLRNTLVAANTADLAGPNCALEMGKAYVRLEGVNLTDRDGGSIGCGLTEKADLVLVSDGGSIGLLADNGGPTQTHALLPGSSAIDAAADVTGQDACGSGDNATDQRGVARPQDGDASGSAQCDVGAVEAGQDYGDARAPYPTLLADNGARHSFGSLYLGATIDDEIDGLPSADASGDGADDDGVTIAGNNLTIGTANDITITVTGTAGKVDAWVDLNQDGDWADADEQVLSSVDVVSGNNVLTFTVSPMASAADSFMRVRLSSAGGLAPTGQAADGEVEDYPISLSPAPVPPTAKAGADQTVTAGDSVTLDGSTSSDADGSISAYQWAQTGGASVTLSDPTAANPSFTAPDSADMLTFTLTVTDDGGLSDTDTVIVTVNQDTGGTGGNAGTSGSGGGGCTMAQNGQPGSGLLLLALLAGIGIIRRRTNQVS